MSLLVIEDLDGRLIYARAGDGEAVFGSDGEFEFADDSSDWWESDEDDDSDDDDDEVILDEAALQLAIEEEEAQANDADVESDPQRLLSVLKAAAKHDDQGSGSASGSNSDAAAAQPAIAGPSSASTSAAAPKTTRTLTTSAESSLEPDEGETTDELGYEEMPYPRLLVGSIAPRGSGISRARARANAQAKKINSLNNNHGQTNISINGHRHPPSGGPAATSSQTSSNSIVSNANPVPSTPRMGPPPSPSIGSASASATVEQPVVPTTPGASKTASSTTPLTPFRKPEMGTFIPSQDKAVHRAIIDGATKAPSPYQRGKDVMTRGLAPKRKHDDSDGRSTRQRTERRSIRGRSPMGMVGSARMNGGPNGSVAAGSGGGGATGQPNGPLNTSVNGSLSDGGSASRSPSLMRLATAGLVGVARSARQRRAARAAAAARMAAEMDPGISLDDLLDMEMLSEGGLVQR